MADADAIGGVLVFTSEGTSVVADAGTRRDARTRGEPTPDAVDRIWTPGSEDKPKRVN